MKLSSLINILNRTINTLGDGVIVRVDGINNSVNICEPNSSSVIIKLKVDFCGHSKPLELTISNGFLYYEDTFNNLGVEKK